jgi:uncharacterized protein YkwD
METETHKTGENHMGRQAKTIILIAMGFLLAACAATGTKPDEPIRVSTKLPSAAVSAAHGSDANSRALVDAINIYRGEHGIPPLSYNGELQRAAAIHSADMAARHFTGHFNPEGQGPNERILYVWPDFKGTYAENIAILSGVNGMTPESFAQAILKKWVANPGQRKNLRSEDYTISDVGIARAENKIYVTELFARP